MRSQTVVLGAVCCICLCATGHAQPSAIPTVRPTVTPTQSSDEKARNDSGYKYWSDQRPVSAPARQQQTGSNESNTPDSTGREEKYEWLVDPFRIPRLYQSTSKNLAVSELVKAVEPSIVRIDTLARYANKKKQLVKTKTA